MFTHIYIDLRNSMELNHWQEWATMALEPTLTTVVVTFLIAMALPFLIHTYLYRQRSSTQLPAFLLVGPSGSGKTSLLTLVRMTTVNI